MKEQSPKGFNFLFVFLETKCPQFETKNFSLGWVILVKELLNVSEGKIDETNGSVSFIVKYKVNPSFLSKEILSDKKSTQIHKKNQGIVYRPLINEVVDALVTRITKLGFFATAGPLSIFVSVHQISEELKFESNPAQFRGFLSDGHEWKIATSSEVRIKLMNVTLQENSLHAVGTINENYLGPM